ncbi:glutaredoxin 2 [Candidatus Erwinia haradaeae]|uniref:Glutaredoxin 2 n=1 Tax=Candidatus Erwinia haradaeae TaxID=1922217 RepID=A0A451D3W8_9GAMM|nr:glutaredoxin 2 [Candidatus Erwinia haradaeae]VFP80355.1 Glutaredoxin 2 [Candidatus Erwinia haradaeae]
MKLYIYTHCPFCIKTRMIFGLKNIAVNLIVLMNNDEITPKKMINKKMVPILMREDNKYMAESLDIIKYVDTLNQTPVLIGKTNPAVHYWLNHVNKYIYYLLIPHIAVAPFIELSTPEARSYFKIKKEKSYGNFENLTKDFSKLINNINNDLQQLAILINKPDSVNGQLSLDDFHLFPLLYLLSLVKQVKYPIQVAHYRDNISKKSKIPLIF